MNILKFVKQNKSFVIVTFIEIVLILMCFISFELSWCDNQCAAYHTYRMAPHACLITDFECVAVFDHEIVSGNDYYPAGTVFGVLNIEKNGTMKLYADNGDYWKEVTGVKVKMSEVQNTAEVKAFYNILQAERKLENNKTLPIRVRSVVRGILVCAALCGIFIGLNFYFRRSFAAKPIIWLVMMIVIIAGACVYYDGGYHGADHATHILYGRVEVHSTGVVGYNLCGTIIQD